MIGEWCFFDSCFSKQECDDLLKSTETMLSQPAHIGLNGLENINNEARRSEIKFLHAKDTRFQHLFDKLWKCAIQANDEFFNFHITRLPFLQLAKYKAEDLGEYKEHRDVFWLNNEPAHRKLSAIIQLTDPFEYEGGDFHLMDVEEQPDATAVRRQGTVIFFPSFVLHKADPVTKGNRESIAAWFEGPKWR